MRICLEKLTGKLIESQSGGDDNPDLMETRLDTLKQNAINAGYAEADIEVRWVTDEEYAAILEANKPIPTYADRRRPEYPPNGDQLDNLTKVLLYLKDHGIDIGLDGEKQVADCLAVKAKYPKP